MTRDLRSGLARFRELGLDPCRARAAQSRDAGNPWQHSPASSWGLRAGWGQLRGCCLPSAPASAQASSQLGLALCPAQPLPDLLRTAPPDIPHQQKQPCGRDPSCLAGFWTGMSLSGPGMHVLAAFKHPEEPLAPKLSSPGKSVAGGASAPGQSKTGQPEGCWGEQEGHSEHR